MKPTLKNDDKLFIRNKWERTLYQSGLPREYWGDLPKIGFKQTPFQGGKLSAAQQRQWLKVLSTETRRNHPIACIGSSPTDVGAFSVALQILKGYLDKGYPLAVANVAEGVQFYKKYPAAIILYNIHETPTAERIEVVRDFCLTFKYSFRLVVVAGATDPEHWCLSKLHLNPSVVFKVTDPK